MSNNFESSFSNPREKRAIAHNTIKRYKDGEATYEEAFKDAYDASHTKKGERSSFGKALGCLAVDAIAHCHGLPGRFTVYHRLSLFWFL